MSIEKLKRGLKLQEAKKQGNEAFILLERLDELEEKISKLNLLDDFELKEQLKSIKQKLNEDIEIELEIE